MKNINKNHDAVVVSWDFTNGEGNEVVLVGYRHNNEMELINSFQGADAREIFKKLIEKPEPKTTEPKIKESKTRILCLVRTVRQLNGSMTASMDILQESGINTYKRRQNSFGTDHCIVDFLIPATQEMLKGRTVDYVLGASVHELEVIRQKNLTNKTLSELIEWIEKGEK